MQFETATTNKTRRLWKAGDKLYNPMTGASAVVFVGSQETRNELFIFDLAVTSHGAGAGEHFHPAIEETFTVVEGRVGSGLPATSASRPSASASWRRLERRITRGNAGAEAARVLVEVRPPARFEAMIDALSAMAFTGQTEQRCARAAVAVGSVRSRVLGRRCLH